SRNPPFDVVASSRDDRPVGRVLAVIAAVALAVSAFANPPAADENPPKKPNPPGKPSPTPPPTSPFVDGIDVSYHQGMISWTQVAGAGKRFAFVRATAGTLTADTRYATNRH